MSKSPKIKRFYQMTKHPRLFNGTYWGNWQCVPENMKNIHGVFGNRDLLADGFRLKKLLAKPSIEWSKETSIFDHVELYSTDNGYVLLSSPYTYFNFYPKLLVKHFALIGKDYQVEIIPPVYLTNAISFIVVIPKGKRNLNQFLHKCKSGGYAIKEEITVSKP